MKVPQDQGITGVQSSQIQSAQLQTAQEKCPFCGQPVEGEMLLCPHCWERIKIVCDNCKRFVQVTWKKCPYCGVENEKMNGNREYAH